MSKPRKIVKHSQKSGAPTLAKRKIPEETILRCRGGAETQNEKLVLVPLFVYNQAKTPGNEEFLRDIETQKKSKGGVKGANRGEKTSK